MKTLLSVSEQPSRLLRAAVLLGLVILGSLLAVLASALYAYAVSLDTPPQVSAGYRHTCLVDSGGSLACWGLNGNGQATPPAGVFTQVSAGMYHTCAVGSDGSLACWGLNGNGQATPPAGVFTQVSAGGSHTCGIRSDGTVACWGWNYYGQATPPLGIFTQLSAGMYHTCGVRSDGGLSCWGWNNAGQTTPPEGVFTRVSAGEMHTCGLKSDGSLACWGLDDAGQATPPAGVFMQVSAGANHSCGLKSDKALACWGENGLGQAEPPAGPFEQVSAGGSHSCALKSDGSLVCWGSNAYGQSPVICTMPPSISGQPASATRTVGQTVVFSVTASGTGLSYQWRKDGSNIAGASSVSYTISSLVLADAGTYDVVVSNACGSITSAAAVLGVTDRPPCTPHFPEAGSDALTVCPDWLPAGAMGATYDQPLWAWNAYGANVLEPYIFHNTPGALPPGLALNVSTSPVTLSGIPVAPGSYNVTVWVYDSHFGTSAYSGYRVYTITVMGTNHAPSFTPGGNVTAPEDTSYSAAWATDISAGGAEDAGQTLTFRVSNNNNALFSVQPAIAADGTLSFTLAPDANGAAIVSVSLKDNGGTANGGSDTSGTVTFQIDVTPVSDPQPGPTFTVNSSAPTTDHVCDEHCTLREAIEAANNDGVMSTIELAPGTLYGIAEVDNTDLADTPTGLPLITSPITINGHGARISRTDAAPYTRLFAVTDSLTLNEVELQYGKLDRSGGDGGGGILNYGSLIVKNSYFGLNEAPTGGAIYNGGTASIYNSTFYANSSNYGALTGYGSWNLYGNTLLNNKGVYFSAMALNFVSSSTFKFYNNLFLSSSSTPLCLLGELGINAAAGNLATDSTCTGFNLTTYDRVNPQLVPDYNGGPTHNVAVNAPSVAIDAGNATACQNANIAGRDQRGMPRFADGNGDGVAQCDVGAYEFSLAQSPPPVEPETDAPQVSVLLSPVAPDGSNDWYRGPVTVTPQALDASTVIELRCALDPTSLPNAFDDLPETLCPFLAGAPVSTDGMHTFYAAAMDIWGNKSEVVSAGFQIDATPPVLTCPAAGPFLLHGGDQMVGPAGVDASVSGLDEAASTLSGVVTTETVGPKTLTFTAFDLAGNSASQACTYNVIFDFGGFYPPVEPARALNEAKAGSAIPLKFSLAGDQGLDVIAAVYPASQAVDCETLEPIGSLEPTEPPGQSGLSYAAGNGWYCYVWKTDKAWAGTCRALVIQLVDGTQHLAYFQFR